MPLLKRKALKKAPMPEFLHDDESVFHCEMTNEIFRDYDEFAERTILCNSMVWTCSLTGKSNLTYVEALQCEKNALKSLKEFPEALKKPVIFLASKTKRSAFGEMAEDVFNYMKDRYFVGETVEPPNSKWTDCKVTQVIAPSEEELKKIQQQQNNTQNGSNQDRTFYPPADAYKYNLETVDKDDRDISETVIVSSSAVRRKKGLYSREKNKLLLKQHVEQREDGVWVIKASSIEEFGINDLKFEEIFDGPLPTFDVSKKIEKRAQNTQNNGKKVKQETLAKFLSKNNVVDENNGSKKNTLLEKMNKKTEMYKKMKEEEREKKSKENYKIMGMLRDWYKPNKDDLELEDHKKLPEPKPVKNKLPDEYLGDALMVVEFAHTFMKLLKTKDFFPGGFTFEMMERALMEKELAGPLIDLIQMLLLAIFDMQEEESNNCKIDYVNIRDITDHGMKNYNKEKAIKAATFAIKWSKAHQGIALSKLPMYPLTITEILRLHFLTSGAMTAQAATNYRYSNRGGYMNEDDPGLLLRLQHPNIIRALAHQNVVQLPINVKVKIINTLIEQLLTYADFRDISEERVEDYKQAKADQRNAILADKKSTQEMKAAQLEYKRNNKNSPDYQKKIDAMNQELEKKQSEFEYQIKEYLNASYNNLVFLGSDRAHRRYLKLESLPGLFVQDEDFFNGACLEEIVAHNPALIGAGKKEIISHIRQVYEEMNTSDKENNHDDSKDSKKSKLITDSQSLIELRMCTTDVNNCLIHSSSVSKPKWAYFDEPEKLDELINALNKRGTRESGLCENIEANIDSLKKLLDKTPVNMLNSAATEENLVEEEENERVKQRKLKLKMEANLGYSLDTPPDEVLHTMVTDYILDLEEKLFAGNLGNIKIKDRDLWREHLQNRNYDDFDKTLHASNAILKKEENGVLPSANDGKIKSETERNGESRASSPDSYVSEEKEEIKKDYKDPGKYLGPISEEDLEESNPELQKAVHTLAIALAQVANGIEARFLKRPLGNTDFEKRPANIPANRLHLWQESLLASTSFSQVSLHYGTLDSCIMWSRSALLAKCRICRRQKDSENMLLCDSCNLGHHLYCLKPKLKSVPAGKWFCYKCTEEQEGNTKKETPKSRKRRIFRDEDVEDDDEENEQSEIKEEVSRKRRKIDYDEDKNDYDDESEDEECAAEEEEQQQQANSATNSDTSQENNKVKVELCTICGSGGDLIFCEKCPKCYHIECVEPPLRRPPRGKWTCPKCNQNHNNKTTSSSSSSRQRSSSVSSRDAYFVSGVLVQRSGANNQRRCAARARHKIHGYAKFLQRNGESDESDSELITNHRRSNRRDVDGRDDLPLHNAALQELLSDVMKHKDAWPFIRPVQKTEVPDYYEVISKPMDFGTIKYKLNMGKYAFDSEMMNDCVLVFENCNTYNDTDAIVYKCGVRLLKYFQKKCKELCLKVPEEMQSDDEQDQQQQSKKRRTK